MIILRLIANFLTEAINTRTLAVYPTVNEFTVATFQFHHKSFYPSPGKHVLTIEDENEETVIRNFEILKKGNLGD